MKDKVQKIREEVERIQLYTQSEVLKQVLDYIDKVQEEPVSMWHDASEEPKPNMELICVGQYGNPLVLSSNSDSFKERYISKWTYFNDLLNLSNAQITTKDCKEPVSEDLEDTTQTIIYNGEVYTRCYKDKLDAFACKYPMSVPKTSKKYAKYSDVDLTIAVKAGAKWQKTKDESTTEDLSEYINELSKQFPEVSFAKLSRIAVRVAKWQKAQFEKNRLKHCDSITNEQAELEQGFIDQHLDKYNRMPTFLDAIEYGMRLQKEQMTAKAIDAQCFGFQGAALFSFRLPADNYLIGSEVKVIIIKED